MQQFSGEAVRRLFVMCVLGFASGLPLALTGTALQAWLTTDGINITTIGFFSLVGLPYTFKFLWAPLIDRFEPPLLGRRKGWIVLTQLGLAASLFFLSLWDTKHDLQMISIIAVITAFLSASQDVVIDAYRTDILSPRERGLGSSLSVFGYRMAMILSGGIAFVWADAAAGNGWSWPQIYQLMSCIMLGLAMFSAIFIPFIPYRDLGDEKPAGKEILGFLALVAVVVVGYLLTVNVFTPAFKVYFPSDSKWPDLCALLVGMAFTLPAAVWTMKKTEFNTLTKSLENFFTIKGAIGILGLIVLYKLGDAFAGSLITNFLLSGVGFSTAEIGVVNKVIGIWLTIVGALLGGFLMFRLGLFKSLLVFGILQMLSNFGYLFVAIYGKEAFGSFSLPAFDFLIVSLKESTHVDWLLLLAVGFENITGGMGTAAFVAFLMSLCNKKFTATQYALLSAFASIGRVWVGPLSGILVSSMGWPSFFVFSAAAAIPGLLLLWMLRSEIYLLEKE